MGGGAGEWARVIVRYVRGGRLWKLGERTWTVLLFFALGEPWLGLGLALDCELGRLHLLILQCLGASIGIIRRRIWVRKEEWLCYRDETIN